MPPISHPFKRGSMVVFMYYNDHAPPHVHVGYQGDIRSYRLEIRSRNWLQPGKILPASLRRLIEDWVETHEEELIHQWNNARQGRPISIVG